MTYFTAPGLIHKKSPVNIIETVCSFTGVPLDVLFSRSRYKGIVKARQMCAYLIRAKFEYRYSLVEIGEMLGGYNHATIISSLRSVNNQIDTDSAFKNDMEKLSKILEIKPSKNENTKNNL